MRKLLSRLFFFLCIGLGTLVFSLFAFNYLIMPYVVNVDKVQVPELRKLTTSSALKRLSAKGLRLAPRDSLYQESIPEGAIVDQLPNSGKLIKKGRRVFVDISKGPRLYTVPEVKQKSLREARLQLESAQLQVGSVAYVSSSSIPRGAIVDHLPSAGVHLARNSKVDLKISSGPPAALKRVPNLVGLPIEVVEDTLKKYEMRLGRLENQVDSQRPAGIVLSQKPSARERALHRTPVNLVVSVQEKVVTEPDSALEDTAENLPKD